MRRRRAGETVMVEKPRIEGRHAHHRCCRRHPVQRGIGREFRQEDHGAANHRQQIAGNEQTVRVIDRQHMKKHIIGTEAPVVAKHCGVRQQIAMAQFRALRPTGCAGGIEDGGQILGPARHRGETWLMLCGGFGKAAALITIKREHHRAAARGKRRDGRGGGGARHDNPRLGIAKEIVKLGGGIAGIERQIDAASLDRGGVERQQHHRFVGLYRNAVAGCQPGGNKKPGKPVGQRREIGKTHLAGVGIEKGLATGGMLSEDAVIEMVGHGYDPVLNGPALRRKLGSGQVETGIEFGRRFMRRHFGADQLAHPGLQSGIAKRRGLAGVGGKVVKNGSRVGESALSW